jgi:hypothetical protein
MFCSAAFEYCQHDQLIRLLLITATSSAAASVPGGGALAAVLSSAQSAASSSLGVIAVGSGNRLDAPGKKTSVVGVVAHGVLHDRFLFLCRVANMFGALVEGLECISSRTLGALSRVCCDLADAGADLSPRQGDDKGVSAVPALASASASAALQPQPPGDSLNDSFLVVRHGAASAGSAMLVDACLDAISILRGLNSLIVIIVVSTHGLSGGDEGCSPSTLLRAIDAICSLLRLPYFKAVVRPGIATVWQHFPLPFTVWMFPPTRFAGPVLA